MRLLLDAGARVDEEDDKGRSPIFYACHVENNMAKNILLKEGADLFQAGFSAVLSHLQWYERLTGR